MGDNESKGLGSQCNTFQIVDYSTKLKVFPGGSFGKESAWNAGDLGSIPGLGRFPGEGNGNPLQYSCLKNSMDRRAWLATVHEVTKSQTVTNTFVVATRSGKQTHSEEQCRQWSAVYYTSEPKAESPLSQGPQPVFVKTLYTLSVRAQTHLPKIP